MANYPSLTMAAKDLQNSDIIMNGSNFFREAHFKLE